MQELYRAFSHWVDDRNPRERLWLFFAVILFTYTVWNVFLQWPIHTKRNQLTSQTSTLKTQVSEINTQITIIQDKINQDPNALLRKKKDELVQEIKDLDAYFQGAALGMTTPQTLLKSFETLLNETPGLKMLQFQSLPPEALSENPTTTSPSSVKANSKNQQPSISTLYKKGLIIRFEGDFYSTINYLKELERLDAHFFWNSLEYTVTKYPTAVITIKVHILSRSEGLVGV